MSADGPVPMGPEELGELLPVAYAASLEEAEHYRQLLEDHDISAVVDEDYSPTTPPPEPLPVGAVAVLVPASLLEDAREVIDDFEDLDVLLERDDEEEQEEEDDGYGEGEEDLEDAEHPYPFFGGDQDDEEEELH